MPEVVQLPIRRAQRPVQPPSGYAPLPEAMKDNFACLEALVASARRTFTGNFCTADRLAYTKGQMQAVAELANMIRKAIP